MRIYDITRPVSANFPVYPGDPAIDITPSAQLAWGDAANVSRLVLSSHPAHDNAGCKRIVGVLVKLKARFLRTGSAQAFEHLNLLFIRL